MNLSKRLALSGAQSAFSMARPRGFGSSIGFIDRRPFPYRQISELTEANGERAVIVDKLAKVMDAGKAEALAGAITNTIEMAKEDVRRHCEESHSAFVAKECARLRVELAKYHGMVNEMLAKQRCEDAIAMNEIEKDIIRKKFDLHKELSQLRVQYYSGKLQLLKYGMVSFGCLAAIGVIGFA
ncbi:unnamed protein product [Microthlaspi erraticum]|uniref:Uncharacterized protein n=1 Tax=Microthlaspi erraticum TaxID=1685480 RepID=A0A6D2I4D9_9BRAS|nr:unnamed protein product [Microthlaspi erraticum]